MHYYIEEYVVYTAEGIPSAFRFGPTSVHLPPSRLVRPIQLHGWCHLWACPAPPTTQAVVGLALLTGLVTVPCLCGVVGLLP